MADGFGVLIEGTKECRAALSAMDKQVEVATAAATKKIGALAKRTVKQQMRGRPRWDRRGASSRTGPEVNLHLSPHHVSKGGGPGKLTGSLSRAVKVSRKPRITAEGASVAVFMGGSQTVANNYKAKIESEYPYFNPGISKAKLKMPAIYEAAWAKAISK